MDMISYLCHRSCPREPEGPRFLGPSSIRFNGDARESFDWDRATKGESSLSVLLEVSSVQ